MSAPSIAVVIVNWNSRDDVLDAIRSLQAHGDGPLDIVVVDNGSADDSVSAIRRKYPDVNILETGENLGFAEGCNRGILESRSEWVFLFNNDAIVAPDCVSMLRAAAAQAAPDVGMIQPRIVFRADPEHVNSSGVIVFTNGCARDRHFGEPVSAALDAGDVFCATAGAALYRRSMLDELRLASGYLDSSFFMYFEDVDLGWRCRLAGWRALYVPDAVVLHRFQASSSRRGRKFTDQHCRINRVRTLLKNASSHMLLRAAPRTLSDLGKVAIIQPLALWRLLIRLPALLRERRQIEQGRKVGRRELEAHWMTTPQFQAPKFDHATGTVLRSEQISSPLR